MLESLPHWKGPLFICSLIVEQNRNCHHYCGNTVKGIYAFSVVVGWIILTQSYLSQTYLKLHLGTAPISTLQKKNFYAIFSSIVLVMSLRFQGKLRLHLV